MTIRGVRYVAGIFMLAVHLNRTCSVAPSSDTGSSFDLDVQGVAVEGVWGIPLHHNPSLVG
jgi:hypothetical protein